MYKIIGGDGREYGPVPAEEIKQWISQGRVVATTKAQAERTSEWKNLADFPEFAAFFGGQAPPPISGGTVPPLPALPPTAPVQVDIDKEVAAIVGQGVVFSIGDCLRRGWELLKADFWPTVGVSALILVIMGAVNSVYVGMLINGPLIGGLYYYFLKKARQQPAQLGDAFAGFSMAFLQLFLLYLITTIFTGLGLLLCIIPGIYLGVAYYLVYPLMMDRKWEFWPTMEVCRRVVTKIWWQVFVFVLVLGLINLAGILLLCVGIFVTFPLTMAAAVYAYESLFNRQQAAA